MKRFWDKVKKGPKCWEWQASLNGDYGQFSLNGKPNLAHRVSWELVSGPIPDGMFVLHRCDNPPCVRPSHLFLGTAQDNVDDMIKKNRQQNYSSMARGERISRAGFTDADVVEIRRKQAAGASMLSLSKLHGVAFNTIWQIVHRKSWTHI